jgi:ATP-dependent DNA ligase
MKTTGSVIVAYDYDSGKDNAVLIVGKKRPDQPAVDIVNAFQGKEAKELWKKLTVKVK